MSLTPEQAKNLQRFLSGLDQESALNVHTDEELADMLLEHVWAHFNTYDRRSWLVSQAIERLRRSKGGPIPDDGDH